MISKLPSWVWPGAWLLAFVAGMVNAMGLMSVEHQSITHLTGSATMLSIAVTHADGTAALHLSALIGAFVLGTILSGLLLPLHARSWNRRYSAVLLLESAALAAAGLLLAHQVTAGLYLAGIACGLQNAMASTLSGTVIRTTHVSGMFTDLGTAIAHVLRRAPVDAPRARICVLVISGFLCGGVAGTAAFARLGALALLVPGVLAATAAVLGQWLSAQRPDQDHGLQACRPAKASAPRCLRRESRIRSGVWPSRVGLRRGARPR